MPPPPVRVAGLGQHGRTFPLIILLSRLRNQSCVHWIPGPELKCCSVDNLPSVYDGCCAAELLTQGRRWITKIVTTAFVNLLFGGGNNGAVEKLFTNICHNQPSI